ncbi:MAG: hypothetical protein EAX81_07690 [Candidatus Thorarchaeota archaeon]|nr:hypothetical protein [Candidatus Thorarchaeota archaeon]
MSYQAEETRSKFLRLMFHEYYRKHRDTIDQPDKIHTREFGIESWDYTWRCPERTEIDDSGIKIKQGCGSQGISFARIVKCPKCGSKGLQVNNWKRHVGFRTQKALIDELVMSAAHSVYHSAAFYKIPVARTMDEKEWQGAELVFDIDADHLSSPCSKEHDAWKCNTAGCTESGMGAPPIEGCPKCGETNFSSRKWLCEKCLDDAKQSTLRVYDKFIVEDFGLDPELIQLNYSGHRGYHIRVKDPRVFKLDSRGRVEIVHYITGTGFRIVPTKDDSLQNRHRVIIIARDMPLPTKELDQFNVPGWGNRVADAMVEFIRSIELYSGDERWAKPLRTHREEALKGLLRTPPVLSANVKGVGEKSWQEIAVRAVEAFGGEIDAPVTHDIHRIIRLIGSLNGKTGFSVTSLTRDTISEFNPLRDSIAITGETLKVVFPEKGLMVPKIRIGDEIYGPYHDETVELPMAAAVFMLCKGVAKIA